jgi:hypothetical protein
MVRSSRGPVRASRHSQRAHEIQPRHFAAGSPVRCGGGGNYHLSTRMGPVHDTEGWAGETVVRLQGPTRSPAPHAWGNGRPQDVPVSSAPKDPRPGRTGWLSTERLVQPASTLHPGHTSRPVGSWLGRSLTSGGPHLRGHAPTDHCVRCSVPWQHRVAPAHWGSVTSGGIPQRWSDPPSVRHGSSTTSTTSRNSRQIYATSPVRTTSVASIYILKNVNICVTCHSNVFPI